MDINTLINNKSAFDKFINANQEDQFTVLESLSPKFKSTDDLQVRQQVLNKVLSLTPKNEPDLPWKDVPGEAVKNFRSSTMKFAKDIFAALKKPISTAMDTVNVIESAGFGAAQKLIPGEQGDEATFDIIFNGIKERYGGEENLKQTIVKDPMGFLQDLSTFAGGVGGAVSKVGKVNNLSKVVNVGAKITKGATLVDPIGAGGVGLAKMASKGVPNTSKSLVKTAIRPGASSRLDEVLKLDSVDNLASEYLNRNLKLNREEVVRLNNSIKSRQKEINDIIKRGDKEGRRIRTNDIARRIDELIEAKKIPGVGEAALDNDIAMLNKVKSQFLDNSDEFLSLGAVQKLKKQLGKSFAPGVQTLTTQIKRAGRDKLRQGAREMLEVQFPALRSLNADEGAMIELQAVIAKRIRQLENSPTFGVKGVMSGIGGAAVGGVLKAGESAPAILGSAVAIGGTAFLVEKILTSPRVHIAVAKAINRANILAAKSGKLHLITNAAFQEGRIQNNEKLSTRLNQTNLINQNNINTGTIRRNEQ